MKIKFPNVYIILLCLIIIQSCAKKSEYFIIHGEVDGVNTGKVQLVKLDLATNEQVNVDSTEIVNGKFKFNGKVGSPYLHTLIINDKSNKIHFFLENSTIDIKATIKDLEHAKINGSKEDSLFRSYKIDDIFDRKKGMEIMLNNPDYAFSAFTAYYQFQIHNIHADTLASIMDNFKEPVKKSTYFKHLNKLYTNIKNVAISKKAPNFKIPDVNGKIVELSDFKGKYVLIDFWASWCAPCRASNPELITVYNTFNQRDFTILGVSIDKDKDRWLKAIKSDKLPWINVSNLKGWDEVSNLYGVKAVPQNFLIDPDGIIIDKNIEPENMIERLNGILPLKKVGDDDV